MDTEQYQIIIKIKPKSKKHQEILTALYNTIAPSHKEEGCIEYRIYHNEKWIYLIGKWKNEMAMQMHLMFAYHIELMEEILPPLCKKISLQHFQELEPPITSLSLHDYHG